MASVGETIIFPSDFEVTGWNYFSQCFDAFLAWNYCLSQNHQFPLNELEDNVVLILSPIISREMNGIGQIFAVGLKGVMNHLHDRIAPKPLWASQKAEKNILNGLGVKKEIQL